MGLEPTTLRSQKFVRSFSESVPRLNPYLCKESKDRDQAYKSKEL